MHEAVLQWMYAAASSSASSLYPLDRSGRSTEIRSTCASCEARAARLGGQPWVTRSELGPERCSKSVQGSMDRCASASAQSAIVCRSCAASARIRLEM